MKRQLRILSLQPFYGGSHREMMEGWKSNSRHDWTVLTLPARFWKWRMRHSAIEFARLTRELDAAGERFDAVFCTDMLNVAEFRGLSCSRISQLPTIVYFHENQYAYPVLPPAEVDLHLAFTNLTSMIAADHIWFNSEFNRQSMRSGIDERLKLWPDFEPKKEIDAAFARSRIEHPGIELPKRVAQRQTRNSGESPHLVWAARWEHDKGPDLLLEVLQALKAKTIDFRVSVIGQSYSRAPSAFDEIKPEFYDRIVYWGYQKSREDYWRVLSEADIFLSTASHEFFGISAAEAIAAGCIPLLPNRLAYPELLNVAQHSERSLFLYDGTADDAAEKIDRIHITEENTIPQSEQLAEDFQNRFGWSRRATELDNLLSQVAIATG